jgi:hypothetical protein
MGRSPPLARRETRRRRQRLFLFVEELDKFARHLPERDCVARSLRERLPEETRRKITPVSET